MRLSSKGLDSPVTDSLESTQTLLTAWDSIIIRLTLFVPLTQAVVVHLRPYLRYKWYQLGKINSFESSLNP